ncbi:MAG: DUF1801 domain-containing protein [Salinivirgaceae bacterium]|jgi:hypothetical protein
MKILPSITTGISETGKVNEFMAELNYPLIDVIQYLRKYILSIDKTIGEGIFYNAPVFFYTGTTKPFDPKSYKRYIVGCNLYKKDTLRMIFLRGASASDPTGLLDGDYKDGRRLVSFKSIDDVKSKEKELKNIIQQLLKLVDK